MARGMGRKRYMLFKVEHGQDVVETLGLWVSNFVNMYVKITSNDEVITLRMEEGHKGLEFFKKFWDGQIWWAIDGHQI